MNADTQRAMFAAVALIVILALGMKWPTATIWILGLILLSSLIVNREALRSAIYGG